MNNKTKITTGLIIFGVLVIWLTASGSLSKLLGQRSKQAQSAINLYKVGVLLPLTGGTAIIGEPAKNVFELAKDEINNNQNFFGKSLEFVYEDGKCDGATAASAVQKLINVDHVQVILGGICSTESLIAVPVAAKNKVLLFSAVSTSPKLSGISPYFFRIAPSDDSEGILEAETAMKKGYKFVAILQEQTDYTSALGAVFEQRFKELGGKTVTETFLQGGTDFRSQLIKLKASNPDTLFLNTQNAASAQRALKQITDLKWRPKFLINETLAGDAKALKENQDLLEGAISAEFKVPVGNAKFDHLQQAYQQQYGSVMPYQSYAQDEYDAVYLLWGGLLQVGNNGEKLALWSRSIKDWQGASGIISIKSDGDRESVYSAEIVKNGEMVPYTAR